MSRALGTLAWVACAAGGLVTSACELPWESGGKVASDATAATVDSGPADSVDHRERADTAAPDAYDGADPFPESSSDDSVGRSLPAEADLGAGPDPDPWVDLQLPVVPRPALCDTAPLAIDLSMAPPASEGRVFERLPPEAIARDGTLVVLSAGDLDGDGRPDLLVRSPNLRVLVNCGDQGFVEAPGLPALDLSHPTASLLHDVDGDGLTDIVLGGPSGGVQTLHPVAPFDFVTAAAVFTRPDEPHVVVTTLAAVGGLLYVGTMSTAPLPPAPLSLAEKHELFGADSAWLGHDGDALY